MWGASERSLPRYVGVGRRCRDHVFNPPREDAGGGYCELSRVLRSASRRLPLLGESNDGASSSSVAERRARSASTAARLTAHCGSCSQPRGVNKRRSRLQLAAARPRSSLQRLESPFRAVPAVNVRKRERVGVAVQTLRLPASASAASPSARGSGCGGSQL